MFRVQETQRKIVQCSSSASFSRIQCIRRFFQIGVDFAGPLNLKDVYSKSKKVFKGYIALFTCASSRAMHLDLVPICRQKRFYGALNGSFPEEGCHTLLFWIVGRPSRVQV